MMGCVRVGAQRWRIGEVAPMLTNHPEKGALGATYTCLRAQDVGGLDFRSERPRSSWPLRIYPRTICTFSICRDRREGRGPPVRDPPRSIPTTSYPLPRHSFLRLRMRTRVKSSHRRLAVPVSRRSNVQHDTD